MSWNTQPKRPVNHVPGKQFVNTGDPYGIKLGVITRVDEVNMKADIKIITGGGQREEIDLTQGMYGPRSFWGGVPELDSLVLIGYRRMHKNLHEAVILGYVPVGNRSGTRFDPFASIDPSIIEPSERETADAVITPPKRYKRLMLKPGDVGGMSAAGSEFTLSKDVCMVNRAGDTIELRDSDRTLVTQAIHRVETDAGIRRVSGPIRRGGFFLPDDIFQTPADPDNPPDQATLRDEDASYYGRDELQRTGPGAENGGNFKFANSEGLINEVFNDFTEFPPVTYSNGRRVFYVATNPATTIEDVQNGAAKAYVEDRFEMSATSDLTQEVLEEIDGFSAQARVPFIERVIGTVAGNDLSSSRGLRQYARVLKPQLFTSFQDVARGKFLMVECDRQALAPDTDVETAAGAFLFRIRPAPAQADSGFACAVTKEGKLYLNLPGSSNETKNTSNISAEVNLDGAIKAYIGASTPERISAFITLAGSLQMDMGRDADGNVQATTFRGGVKTVFEGSPSEDDVACQVEVRGVKATVVSGEENKVIEGKKISEVSGMVQMRCDRYSLNAFSGYSLNAGEKNEMITGKSQLQYALAIISTIVAGGEVKTVLAGAMATTLAAGALSFTVAAGATNFANPAGAFNIVVGTGALAATTTAGAVTLSTGAGAVAVTAGGGAMALTAGGVMTLTAPAMTVTSAAIQLGGPAAVFGVLRGVPGPPGPTLNPLTGLPFMFGSPTVYAL